MEADGQNTSNVLFEPAIYAQQDNDTMGDDTSGTGTKSGGVAVEDKALLSV